MLYYHGVTELYDTFWLKTWRNYSEKKRWNLVCIRSLYDKTTINPTVLQKLRELSKNIEFFYITSRDDVELRTVTEKWMGRCDLPFKHNLIFSGGNKLSAVINNNIDVLVEDQLKYLEQVEGFCDQILISHPWNREGQEQILTYRDLEEYLDELLVDEYPYHQSDLLYDSYRESRLL
jgi:uncharacterized HAD superfamily protein